MKRSSLEWILRALALGSWIWLLFSNHAHPTKSLCLIKNISGQPCPACGTTRSIMLILDGHFWEASLLNPMGWFGLLALIGSSILLLIDWILSKKWTETFFLLIEQRLKTKPLLSLIIIFLLIINWIWSIQKQL